MILLLQTTTFSAHGGIPTYNRVMCRALQDFSPDLEKHVLIMSDAVEDIESQREGLPNLRIRVFSGRLWSFVADLLRIALTRRVNLVLIGHVNYAPLGLVLKLLAPRLRYGVMIHGIEVWRPLPHLKRYSLQHADFITSVSQYSKDRVVSINDVSPDRIYLLPNALECTESENVRPERDPLLPSCPKLLSVCRLTNSERYKGVDTVIAALPAVIHRIPNLQYYVIGDGSDLERHKSLARQTGVEDRVHFLGLVGASTLEAYYRACDVFVMPSAGEGFGIVYLEAMQHGKPVVAARSSAVPEVVIDGITGRLVEYGNKTQIAKTLIELFLDEEQRWRLGSAGYERVQKNFTFSHFKEALARILARELSLGGILRTDVEFASDTNSYHNKTV